RPLRVRTWVRACVRAAEKGRRRPSEPVSPCAGEEAQTSGTAFPAQTTKQLSAPSSVSSPETPSDGQVVLRTGPFLWARQLTV
ncbi:unnamed protein product, partial [Gulo gulo]